MFSNQINVLVFFILIGLFSCGESESDIRSEIHAQLSISLIDLADGVVSKKYDFTVNDFEETRTYYVNDETNAGRLLYRMSFEGNSGNMPFHGYLQLIGYENDMNKVKLTNDSWQYVNANDMIAFLEGNIVIVINEAGFNDENDSGASQNIVRAKRRINIFRSFSGDAFFPYQNDGYRILDAEFNGYIID
ncbi:MAG: hypothetical protein ACJA0X_001438 [Cyclobacteriaceae bacterium]|jgi:hypothetical protein